MQTFVIFRSKLSEISTCDSIEHVFKASSLEEAQKTAEEYLLGNGLPCQGDVSDRFVLCELKMIPNWSVTSSELWQEHIRRGDFMPWDATSKN